MEIDRWHPSTTLSKREERLMKRLTRTRKLFGFLRMHRHELFDEKFQAELESMYRGSGAGKPLWHRRSWRWRCSCKAIRRSPTPMPWN